MKFLAFILLLVMPFAACNADSKKSNKTTSKGKKVENTQKPQYVITATQNGKTLGTITIETFPDIAPKHAANFDSLVSIGFYDGTAFHRVIPGFMIQGGDPNTKKYPDDRSTWGMGDPSQTKVPAEFSKLQHKRGILSAARSNDINSASSQFFIVQADAFHLDEKYSIYGQVLEGMDIVDAIVNTPKGPRDDPKETITMKIVKKK